LPTFYKDLVTWAFLANFKQKMPHVEIGGINQIYIFIDEILKYAIFISPTWLGF
jgi:hypothetical protein